MNARNKPKAKPTGRSWIMLAILAFLIVMPLGFMLVAFESVEIEKAIMLKTSQAPIGGNASSAGVIGVDKMDTMPHLRVNDRFIATTPQMNGKKKKRIAYAISITKDGFFQDGAAVLAYSILQNSRHYTDAFDISLVAFVHPLVSQARPLLQKIGYHVIETPMPINITAIPYKFLREKINNNGCCGASELIKLNMYRLLQYDKVIHMDADTFILNPLDDLLKSDYSLIYTTDPNMATHKGEDRMPSQGGFLIVQPSEQDFRNIVNTMMTTEFKQGGAWNGSKIGWFWGGMTIQGILPYYYNRVTTPGRRLIIDRCTYNTMADTPECLQKQFQDVVSAHFTICQKPWTCYDYSVNPLCKALHTEWFRLRRLAEAFYNIPVEDTPCSGHPQRGQGNKVPGNGKYIAMKMENAHMPAQHPTIKLPVPDDSPDILTPPKPESRYIGEQWDNFVGGHVSKPKKKKPKPKER